MPGGPPRGFAGAQPNIATPYATPPTTQVPVPPARSVTPRKKGKGGVIALLVAIVALAAGGIWFITSSGDDDDAGSSGTAAKGSPGATVEAYFDALRAEDWKGACAVMSKELQDQASTYSNGASCADAIAQAGEGEDPPGKVKVHDAEIDGDRAVVKVEEDGNDFDYDLVRQDGRWLITIRQATSVVATTAASSTPQGNTNAANAAACDANFRTAQLAAEAYQTETGNTATAWEDLVPDYIRSAPEGMELVDGQVTRTPGGPCA
jgi:hypothetical protein